MTAKTLKPFTACGLAVLLIAMWSGEVLSIELRFLLYGLSIGWLLSSGIIGWMLSREEVTTLKVKNARRLKALYALRKKK